MKVKRFRHAFSGQGPMMTPCPPEREVPLSIGPSAPRPFVLFCCKNRTLTRPSRAEAVLRYRAMVVGGVRLATVLWTIQYACVRLTVPIYR